MMNDEDFRRQLDLEKDEIYLKNVAKLGSSANNIYTIDNFLSNEEYQKIFNFINNYDETSWVKEPWTTERTPKESIPEYISELLKKIFQTSRVKCMDYYDVELSNEFKGDYIIRRWSIGSKMRPHVDTDSQKHLHIIGMYYLNDDYDGGEIVFPDYDLKIKPKQNSFIMFPGNENYVHEVSEVLKGFRHTFQVTFIFSGSTFIGPTTTIRQKGDKNYG